MDAMDPRGDLYWTNLAQASNQKRGHADAFGLTTDNDENQPAQKKVSTPQIGAALFTQPSATKRARAESFDSLFDEAEMGPAPKKARIPLAPVTVNTPSIDVYNDEDEDNDSLFNDKEDDDNDSLFNDKDDDLNCLFEQEEDDFCSSEDLEAAIAEQANAAAAEAQAKEMAERQLRDARQEELRKELAAQEAVKAAEEKAQAEAAAIKQAAEVAKQQAAVTKAVAKQARKVARKAAAKEAAENAEKEKMAEAIKADEKAYFAKQWKEVIKARKQSWPNSSKTTAVPKVNPSSLVIDLTDDEPVALTSYTQKSPALPKSSPLIIDLSEDDSNEFGDASQQDSPLRHGTEAATLWAPAPNERITPCLGDLEFPYNTNGFPLQQAKMVCRRTTKQERAAKPNLGSHIKELDLPENIKLNRELLDHTIANTSISINGQKDVKDTIVPLVESLHSDALQSIRYVDGSMHLLSDFRLLADRCQMRGVKLAVEELRVQPTWLWTAPGWHRFVCTAGAKCNGRRCACKKISKQEGNLPAPEVRDVDLKGLLGALEGSTGGEAVLGEVVLRHGIKTLSECLTWTKVLSINLGFNFDDFKMSIPSIKEARDNLLAVDDRYRVVFRKRLESQDCELVVRYASGEEKNDSARSYQEADAEMLEWLETLSVSQEGSAQDMMGSDSTEASATTPPTENGTEDTVDDVVSSQEKMRKMMRKKEIKKEKRLKRQEDHARIMMSITRGLTTSSGKQN